MVTLCLMITNHQRWRQAQQNWKYFHLIQMSIIINNNLVKGDNLFIIELFLTLWIPFPIRILSIIHHRQNPLESTRFQIQNFRRAFANFQGFFLVSAQGTKDMHRPPPLLLFSLRPKLRLIRIKEVWVHIDRLCGLMVRVPGYKTEMYCVSYEVRTECYVEESRPPLWSSGQSSWLQNGDVLCFLWGSNWIDICYAEESRPPLWSSGQSSRLQIQRYRVQFPIFWEVVGLERSPLSVVSTIEELIVRKSSVSGLESREYCHKDPSRWPRGTIYPRKLALTSPTSFGCSVGVVRSLTHAMELLWVHILGKWKDALVARMKVTSGLHAALGPTVIQPFVMYTTLV
jgi:hypothetical protein